MDFVSTLALGQNSESFANNIVKNNLLEDDNFSHLNPACFQDHVMCWHKIRSSYEQWVHERDQPLFLRTRHGQRHVRMQTFIDSRDKHAITRQPKLKFRVFLITSLRPSDAYMRR